jgi:ribosome-binding protein aMBF1 (putative translation factor)
MTSNNTSVIVASMPAKKRADVPFEEVLAQEKARDPEFAQWWERTAPAREVAVALMGYRAENDLSQLQLAQLVGVKQPQIARWEIGEALPSPANLARLAGKLGIEFTISYAPTDHTPKHLTKRILEEAVAYEEHDATVRFAARS